MSGLFFWDFRSWWLTGLFSLVAVSVFQGQSLFATIEILQQPSSQTLSAGANATFSVQVSGSGPFLYQWEKNDIEITGATSATLSLFNLRLGDAGAYRVTIRLQSDPDTFVVSEEALLVVQPPNTPVSVPDTALASAIRSALGLTSTESITQRNIFELEGLSATNRSIVDLTGLNFALNLRSLNLSGNSISVLTPLANLTALEAVNLSGNFLDLSPGTSTAGIVNDLRLRGAEVILDGQRQRLVLLTQPSDQFSVPGGSATFSVRAVSAEGILYQWQKDGTALTGETSPTLRLSDLSAENQGVYRVELRSAGQVLLSDSARLSLTTLEDSPTFVDSRLERAIRRSLRLRRGDPVTAEDMRQLVSLDLSKARVESLRGLEFAINLMDLRMPGNEISDLRPLRGLNQLIWLDLTENRITDVEPLRGLQNLAWLYLDQNFIRDITPLGQLPNLVELRIRRNFLDPRPGRPAFLTGRSLDARGTTVRLTPQSTPPQTDVDGDGIADLVFFNPETAALRTWILNGRGNVFEDVDIGSAAEGWVATTVGDASGNGIADVVWFQPDTRQTGLFFSEGAEVGISWQFIGLGPQDYEPLFLADLLDNGFPDLIWYAPSTGQIGVWFQYESGFDLNFFLMGQADTKWRPVAIAPFSTNSRLGLLWHNPEEGQVSVWSLRDNGTLLSWDIIGVTEPEWEPFAVGDLNGNGRVDIGYFRPDSGEVAAMLLSPSGVATVFMGLGAVERGWAPVAILDAYANGIQDLIFSRFEDVDAFRRFRLGRPPSDRIGILALDALGNPGDWRTLRLIEEPWQLLN